MLNDLRYGLRMLVKSPGFTAVVVLSLALGIGANTAIFSLIDAVMLKMLPVKAPGQLRLLNWLGPSELQPHGIVNGDVSTDEHSGLKTISNLSYPTFEKLRDQNQVFSHLLGFASAGQMNVTIEGQAELADGQFLSGDYGAGLGVRPILGRAITTDDDKVGNANSVAMISYGYWRRRFGADPSVVGRTINLNRIPFTIIGVTPPEFFGLQPGESPDIWVPISLQPQVESRASLLADPDTSWVFAVGRLKPGVSEQQASAGLAVLMRQITAESRTHSQKPQEPVRIKLTPASKGLDSLRRQFSQPLFILMAVVGLVLLIACANVANLLLARATTRQREIAIRLAVGAGRVRLLRQLLTESILLALMGGLLGLLFAYWLTDLLQILPSSVHFTLDFRVLGFTAGIAVVTGILFGLAPALRATRLEPSEALKGNSRSLTSSGSKLWLNKGLVVSQVALSLLLLIGAGLLVGSLQNLMSVDPGFEREKVLLFSIDPLPSGYKQNQLAGLSKQVRERIEAIPGVRSASLSGCGLISGCETETSGILSVEGARPETDKQVSVYDNAVGPRFFETMGIPLLIGREFGEQDSESSSKVAVINETMVRQCFNGENPLGRHFGWGPENRGAYEVVGVVKNAKYNSLRSETPPTVYLPYYQRLGNQRQITFEVRTVRNPVGVISAVRSEMQVIDKSLPIFNVKTQEQSVEESLSQERLFAKFSSFFGLLALLLACIGLYGIMSYAVVRRTNEIGIRMALGAQRGNVLWLVLKETLSLIIIGVAIGLCTALAATRVISSMLFGMTATDPSTIAMATLVLVAVAAFAGYLPAKRASQVDPMVALRYE